ncbi:MAG: hypothetical protein WC764_03535 [Candidatus Paceibacterota bacterium]|jgi:hypothetical protein
MSMDDLLNYAKLKENAFNYYRNVHIVFSPALNKEIHLPSEGFNHILFKNHRTERERPSQILRFKLLPLAIKLIGLSTTYQEFEETVQEFSVKSHKARIQKTKSVHYWGIIAIIDGRKIKVIIRRVGDNGLPHFWSIVPAWVTNRYRDTKFFTTMKGHPDED